MTTLQKDTELKRSEKLGLILKFAAFLIFLIAIVLGAKYGLTIKIWIIFGIGLILFIASIFVRIWRYKELFRKR